MIVFLLLRYPIQAFPRNNYPAYHASKINSPNSFPMMPNLLGQNCYKPNLLNWNSNMLNQQQYLNHSSGSLLSPSYSCTSPAISPFGSNSQLVGFNYPEAGDSNYYVDNMTQHSPMQPIPSNYQMDVSPRPSNCHYSADSCLSVPGLICSPPPSILVNGQEQGGSLPELDDIMEVVQEDSSKKQ